MDDFKLDIVEGAGDAGTQGGEGTEEVIVDKTIVDKHDDNDDGVATPGVITGELAKEKDEDDGDKADLTEDQQVALVKANYELLVEKGVLPDGLEVNSFDDLANHVDELRLEGINDFKKEMPEDLATSVDAWQKGLDYKQAQARKQEIVKYKAITDEQLKDQKIAVQVIKNYHKHLGDSDDYIKARIDTIVDTETTVLEGKRARNALVRVQEENDKNTVQEELTAKQAQQKQAEEYKKSIETKVKASEIFWGKKLSTVDQQEVMDAIFDPKVIKRKQKDFKTLDEAIQEDPTIYAQIYYAYMKGMFGENGNLNFIGNAVKSNATKKIDKVLQGGGGNASILTEKGEHTHKGIGLLDTIRQNLRP